MKHFLTLSKYYLVHFLQHFLEKQKVKEVANVKTTEAQAQHMKEPSTNPNDSLKQIAPAKINQLYGIMTKRATKNKPM